MTGIVSVYATFANADEARQVARIVVEERLAACANVLGPCQSIYRWQGAVEEATEVAAIFKTRTGSTEALTARIAELHSYDLPAVVVWPVGHALESYRDWVANETSPPGD